jgi:amidohydrolase
MKTIFDAVEKHRKLILEAERYIWKNPETGYKEFKTSKYMEDRFLELGYDIVKADGITGFYADIDTGKEGPSLLILGELDSVVCPAHPESDPTTGAVHACGHNAQCAALLGIAAALKEPHMLDGLSGKIRLCAVPAEEFIEIEYRKRLIKEGKIKYCGGKSEFLSRGYFDGIDLAFMVHMSGAYSVSRGSVGFVGKSVIYKGQASHAGGSPWAGKNALYAANCGLNAVNAIRETFKESDLIRFHPIITGGGDIVNAIPETATIESYTRGATFGAILNENKKINRALIGAALSVGTNIEIIDTPGYAPLLNATGMIETAIDAAKLVMPDYEMPFGDRIGTGSTDMGDLSSIMPVVHPYAGGARGKGHGNDYEIFDPEAACVTNAKWQLTMMKLLLENGAERAKKIVAEYKAPFASKEEFLSYLDSLNSDGDRIIYNEDGTASVNIG